MTPEVMMFEYLRRQAIEEDLEFYRTARELIVANKLRNEDVWEAEEAEKTEKVLRMLDAKISDRERDLEA